MIQVVKIEDAVGQPLAHDITEIRPGKFKGPAFHRGYRLRGRDLEDLRRLGKNHLYVLKCESDEVHEDAAAIEIAGALCGSGVGWSGAPREGKISICATCDGLLKVDVKALMQFNMTGDVMCATRHTNSLVQKGDKVAATRAIPLLIPRGTLQTAVAAASASADGVLRVMPLAKARAGVLITGDEVYHGRIKDRFQPVIRKKVAEMGGEVLDLTFLPDDDRRIADAAKAMVAQGANLLITTGGMSVDPDDRTRHALKKAGAVDMVYGAAVLPGAMFMVTYLNNVPVLGIPSGGMYAGITILDLVMPRILTGEKITRREIAMLGHGGMCLRCNTCTFPVCPFGK